jgi:hypothetical protein
MLIPSSGSPVLLRADQGPHEVVKRPFVKGPSNTALHPTTPIQRRWTALVPRVQEEDSYGTT